MSKDLIIDKIKSILGDMRTGFYIGCINYTDLLKEIEEYAGARFIEGYERAKENIAAERCPHKKHRAKIKELEEKVKFLEGINKNIRDALQARVEDDLRRLNREFEPFSVSFNLGPVSFAHMPEGVGYYTRDAYLISDLAKNGYAVAHCQNAVKAIKGHLDMAFRHGKDVAERECGSQIEYLQKRLKHQEDRTCAKKRELETIVDDLNAKYESVTESMQATINEQKYMLDLEQRSDEHMHGIISKLEREKKELEGDVRQRDSVISQLKDLHNKLKCQLQESFVMLNNKSAKIKELEDGEWHRINDDWSKKSFKSYVYEEKIKGLEKELQELNGSQKWHDAEKFLPYGNRRLQMNAKGVGEFGQDVYFTGYGKAVHGDGGAMMWRFEKEIPFLTDDDGCVVSWRYADE